MLRIGILLAGIVVCLPALAVAIFLYDVPGAAVASLAAFVLIYIPFVIAAIFADRMKDMFKEMIH